VAEGSFTDDKRKAFTLRDFRFTTCGQTLYAIVLGWPPEGEIAIRSLGANACLRPEPIESIQVLGSAEPVKWLREPGQLRVKMPTLPPCSHAWVLKIG
jgi:alpha-L-fucosidase